MIMNEAPSWLAGFRACMSSRSLKVETEIKGGISACQALESEKGLKGQFSLS